MSRKFVVKVIIKTFLFSQSNFFRNNSLFNVVWLYLYLSHSHMWRTVRKEWVHINCTFVVIFWLNIVSTIKESVIYNFNSTINLVISDKRFTTKRTETQLKKWNPEFYIKGYCIRKNYVTCGHMGQKPLCVMSMTGFFLIF